MELIRSSINHEILISKQENLKLFEESIYQKVEKEVRNLKKS
jgi:hypothetical protein